MIIVYIDFIKSNSISNSLAFQAKSAAENRATSLCTKLATVAQLCNGLTTDALKVFFQAASGLGSGVIISFVLNWRLTLVLFAFSISIFVARIKHANMNNISSKDNKETDVDSGGKMMIQCTENIKTVVSLGSQNYFIERFDSIFENILRGLNMKIDENFTTAFVGQTGCGAIKQV